MNKSMEGGLRILAISNLPGQHCKTSSNMIDDLRPDWIMLCGDLLPDLEKIPGEGNPLQARRDFWQAYQITFIREFAVTKLRQGNHEIEGFQDQARCRFLAGLGVPAVRLEGEPAEFGAWGSSREWEKERLEREHWDQLRDAPEPCSFFSHVPPFGSLDTIKAANTWVTGPWPVTFEGAGRMPWW